MKVLMIGGSGAVGKATVASLLRIPELEQLTLLGRRSYEDFPKAKKITQVVVDFDNLASEFATNHSLFVGHSVIISSLGTTRAIAKDKETYRRIEVDYPVTFAQLAKNLDAKHAVLVSSTGASASSFNTYLAQKGEVENEWIKLGFDTLTILRPGFIGRGKDARPVEKLFGLVLHPIPSETIGRAIANRVRSVARDSLKEKGPQILKNKEIKGLALSKE